MMPQATAVTTRQAVLMVLCAVSMLAGSAYAGENRLSIENADHHREDSLLRNCGVHCVYLALRIYGLECSLDNISSEFNPFGEYVDLAQCKSVLQKHGLVTRAYELENATDIMSLPALAILPVRVQLSAPMENHFVLFVRADMDSGDIHFCSPLDYVQAPFEQFARTWSGQCLVVAPHESVIDRWEARIRAQDRGQYALKIARIGAAGASVVLMSIIVKKLFTRRTPANA